MRRSLFWRIIIPVTLATVAAAVVISLAVASHFRSSFQNDLKGQLTREANFLAEQTQTLISDSPDSQSLELLTEQAARNLDCRVTIIAPEGTVLTDSQAAPAQMENHLDRPEVQAALQGGTGYSIRFSDSLFVNMMYVAVPIRSGGEIIGVMRLAVPNEPYEANVSRISRTVIWIMVLTFLIELLILTLLAITIVRPIRQLTQKSINYDLNSIWQPLTTKRKDEIGKLNHAFDHMVKRISDQYKEKEIEHTKLTAVLNTMSDGILIVTADGTILMDNPAVRTMFNMSGSTSSGQSLAETVREYQITECFQNCQRSQKAEEVSLELPLENIYIRCTALPLTNMLPGHVLLVFQDLTAIHQADTIRKDFVSNVSHELRTPLTSMRVLTETLETTLHKDKSASEKFLKHLNNEIDNLIQLVEELLELARIESNRVPLQIVDASPVLIIDTAIGRLALQAKRAGLSISKYVPKNIPSVKADPDRIQQVLINLIHNAIKFSHSPGHIKVGAKAESGMVTFFVADTGIGIPESAQKRIFERFYKVDRSRSETGTGLGLSICKHLVEAHGGRIWVESEEKLGSTFLFSLPAL